MVGSAVVSALLRRGYTNLILRTRAELDLFNQAAVKMFFEKEQPEYVILAAARVGGIAENMEAQADLLFENLEIQNNVIWNAHLSGVKKLLFLGSSCIYPCECPQPMKEDYLLGGKPEPTNEGYAIAKIAGLKLCEKIYEQYSEDFITCVPTNLYGERDNFDPRSGHVIPALMQRIHWAKQNNDPTVSVWGSGKTRREFLDVDDLADALLLLMDKYDQKLPINIGTGKDVSIRELAVALKDTIGYEGELVFDETKPDGMPRKLLDVSRINALGWRYSTELPVGLKKMYRWYLENHQD